MLEGFVNESQTTCEEILAIQIIVLGTLKSPLKFFLQSELTSNKRTHRNLLRGDLDAGHYLPWSPCSDFDFTT